MGLHRRVVLVGALIAMPAMSRAEAPLGLDAEFLKSAGYFEAGPIHIYPSLITGLGYDTNIFDSAHDKQSSVVTRVIPEVSGVLPLNTGLLQIGAQADDIRYTESSADDFTDRTFYARAVVEANYRNRFSLTADNMTAHDPRGTGLTEGFDPNTSTLAEPDVYTDQHAAFKYEFGARTAPGMLRFSADYLDHTYDNHRDRTLFFDRDEIGGSAAFLWRVRPRTALVFEGRERKIEYAHQDPAATSLDSRERSLLVGAEWDATGSTSGSVRIGHRIKQFDASDRTNGSDLVWEADMKWMPRSYSTFELDLQRTPSETNGVGDFIDTRSYLLSWSNQWAARFGTRLAFSYQQQSYQNAVREERTKGALLGLKYEMRRWLIWHLDVEWRDRSSDIAVLEFERNRYWLTAEFRL